MKQHSEQFEPNEHQHAPKTLVPNVLAQLGLERTSLSADTSAKSLIENLHADDWKIRITALEALSRGGYTAVEPLLTALHDEDASVRAVAVRVLGKMDDRASRVGLEAALHDADWHVRETAVFVLGQSISPPVGLLAIAAQDDEDVAVREAATMMLQEIQTEDITIQLLPTDEISEAPSNKYFSGFYDYKNYLWAHVQDVGDRIMQREQAYNNNGHIVPDNMTQQNGKGKQRPLMRVLETLVAAMVVLGVIGSWVALTHGVRTSTHGHIGSLIISGSRFYHQDEMTPDANWTSNGKYIYIYDKRDTVLHFIDVATRQVITIANPDVVAQTPGKMAALTPDGLSVCTIDNTGSALHVQVQSVLTKKILFDTFYPKLENINTGINFQWSNDGTRIDIRSNDGTITLLNVTKKQPPVVLRGAKATLNTVNWSQDDKQIIATTSDGLIVLWNATTGQRTLAITVPSYATTTYSLSLSPDGKHIALVPHDKSIQILDASTGEKLFTYHDVMYSQNIDFAWFDNTHIISISENIASDKPHVQIWNAMTGHTTLDVPVVANSRWSTSYNNKYVVVQAPNTTTSQVWDATTSRKIATHASSSPYLPGSSPNEKYFITTAGGVGNKIDMWSATTGKTVAIYQSSDSSVVNAQGSPNGKYLLSISTDGRTNPVGTTLDLWQMPD